MSAIPGGLSTERGPPMTVPLVHFLVGFAFLSGALVLAGYAGLADASAVATAALHLLLAGWVGVTILGATTQFVPVWSGVDLHSRRLSVAQLWLVAGGVPLLVAGMATGRSRLLVVGGGVAIAGFWLFAYNLERTLAAARPLDVTEFHFAWTLGFVVLATGAGLALAATYAGLVAPPVDASALRAAHVTLAVFGVVLTTVFGALYQLATMFTQTDLGALDRRLQTVETYGYPVGVLALAGGRLFGATWLGRAGALIVLVAAACVAVVLARRLIETRVGLTPMLRRYGLVAVALAGWVALTAPAWLVAPTDPATVLGPAGADRLLPLGVVGLVVVGSLYHVVPFVVWVGRYSDRLGREPVPMVDDLYEARVARVDLVATTAGIALLVAAPSLAVPGAAAAGFGLLGLGVLLVVANLLSVLALHGPSAPSLLSALRPV